MLTNILCFRYAKPRVFLQETCSKNVLREILLDNKGTQRCEIVLMLTVILMTSVSDIENNIGVGFMIIKNIGDLLPKSYAAKIRYITYCSRMALVQLWLSSSLSRNATILRA